MKHLLFLLIPVAAMAQIERPRLGWMLDGNSALRPAYGIAAGAALGETARTGVSGFACSASRCIVKSDTAAISYDAASPPGSAMDDSFDTANTPEGTALIALDAGGAFLYFPETGQAARWNLSRSDKLRNGDHGAPVLEYFEFSPSGEILALRATHYFGAPAGFDYAVRRDDKVWIEHFSRDDGSVTAAGAIDGGADAESAAALTVRAVELLDDGYVASTNESVALVRSDGTRRDFPVPGVNAFYAMSADYIEAVSDNGNWVLCVAAGRESANLLPGFAQ